MQEDCCSFSELSCFFFLFIGTIPGALLLPRYAKESVLSFYSIFMSCAVATMFLADHTGGISAMLQD